MAFDNSPQNVKNDEKLAPERSRSPHRRRRRRLAYVLVMACVVLLLGCHVAALPLAHALSLSCSLSLSVLCCASANIFAALLFGPAASLASSFFVYCFFSLFLVRPALVGCRIISSKVRISAGRAHCQFGAYATMC